MVTGRTHCFPNSGLFILNRFYELNSKDFLQQPILITSISAPADLSDKKNLFIGFDGNVCGNGAKALGVLNANTNLGNQAPVMAIGIALTCSGAAINKGAKVQSDANGKAITFAAGEVNGYALDAAAGADEFIRIKLV